MASTDKTTNLNLSQFIDTDKPSWLTDYNNDMDSIDEGVGTLRAQVDATDTAVAALQETAETLSSDLGTVQTAVGAVETAQEELASTQLENMNDLEARMDSTMENKANISDTKWKLWGTWTDTGTESTVRELPPNFDELLVCLTSNNLSAMGGTTVILQIPNLQLTSSLLPFIFGTSQITAALPGGLYGIYAYMRFSKTQFTNGPTRAKGDGTTYMINITNTINVYYR